MTADSFIGVIYIVCIDLMSILMILNCPKSCIFQIYSDLGNIWRIVFLVRKKPPKLCSYELTCGRRAAGNFIGNLYILKNFFIDIHILIMLH